LLLAAWIAGPLIAQDNGAAQPVGFPTDWSHKHLIFTDGGSLQSQLEAQRDPRYGMQWMRRSLPLWRNQLAAVNGGVNSAAAAGEELALGRIPLVPRPRREEPNPDLKGDWNFDLWTGNIADAGVAPYSYPAKYTFNPIANADCTNDFVIYGLWNDIGSPEADLVGVNNLYVGQTSTSPLCGSPSGNNGGSGSAPTPQVKWAFNVGAAGNIPGSVALNLTGTKVAYVVNGGTSVLHVLTLGPGGGTITAPILPSAFGACNTAGPSLCTVTLGSVANHSAIFADYTHDAGYVGDNSGHLYKIINLFSAGGAAPAIASGWPITAGSGVLGAPVYDAATDTVFVGSSDGKLYGFNATTHSGISGSPLTLAANSVSDGDTSYGIYSPPIVDATNHVLYAFYGKNSAGAGAEAAQVVFTSTPTFSGSATAALTTAGTNKAAFINTVTGWTIPDGAFSQSYFNSFSSSASFLYSCGSHTSGNPYGVSLQQFRFDSNRILQSTVSEVNVLTATGYDSANFPDDLCSPVTEFLNGSTDRLFVGVPAVSNIDSVDITSNAAGTSGTLTISSTTPLGTSGIIVDGADSSSQASSIYFTALHPGTTCTTGGASGAANPRNDGIGTPGDSADICAYKLTQTELK
jgi:hypothetical protein